MALTGSRSFALMLAHRLSRGVRREKVFEHICESGAITGAYVLMCILSAAIATLGLLLSSPAVVIGAMLLSPLMGPIVLLGFSFWTIDWPAAKNAISSLAAGCGVALAVAVVLTWASPLKEATPEILARTRPNLFDLLVAAFSGVAGGYAVIRQRNETIIGVAIATALMPPIATVGFGIGIRDWNIALGALLLFATNLIAIALAAAAMAALYGFRAKLVQRGWVGQSLVVGLVAVLCVPLTLSLNTIARESRATAEVRGQIHRIFGPKSRLTSLSVHQTGGLLDVDALVATPSYIKDASARLDEAVGAAVGRTQISLDQVVLADPAKFAAAVQERPRPDPVAQTIQDLKRAIPFTAAATTYDPDTGKAVVLLDQSSGLDIPTSMKLEQGLRVRPGLANTTVVPALQPLPPVSVKFDEHGAPQFGPMINADIWALQRWRTASATAISCDIAPGSHARSAVAALQAVLQHIQSTLTRGSRAECRDLGVAGAVIQIRPG